MFRTLFLVVLVGGCLIHWHWKASLISHLSVVLPFNPFSSLEELLYSPYQITLVGNSSRQALFEDQNSGVFHELWLSKFSDKNKSLQRTTQEAYKIATNPAYTVYTTLTSARNLEEFKNCKLIWTNFVARKIKLAFAFPKNSPYVALFNSRLQTMFESGEIMRIIEKHSMKSTECQQRKGMPLGFENIAIVFIILFFGLSVSIVFCVIEWTVPRKALGLFSCSPTRYETGINSTNNKDYLLGYECGYTACMQHIHSKQNDVV